MRRWWFVTGTVALSSTAFVVGVMRGMGDDPAGWVVAACGVVGAAVAVYSAWVRRD